jgi:hypothetical protein
MPASGAVHPSPGFSELRTFSLPATPVPPVWAVRQNRCRLYLREPAEVEVLGWNRLPSVAVASEWFRAPQSGDRLEPLLES